MPSMYRVKSTTTSRRFAGQSSNESRVMGQGSRPPSVATSVSFMHCSPSGMRYWPSSSSPPYPSDGADFGPCVELIMANS